MNENEIYIKMFKALGNSTRLAIMQKIMKSPYVCSADTSEGKTDIISQATCVGTIASEFNYSLPTISRHLKELKDSDLIKMYKVGSRIIVEPNTESITRIKNFLDML